MKKTLALLLALCMLLAMIPVLAEENAAGSAPESASGTWYLVMFGLTAGTFNLNEDGSAAVEFAANGAEQKLEGSWAQDADRISLTVSGQTLKLILSGTELTIDPEGLSAANLIQTGLTMPDMNMDLSALANLVRFSREPGKITMAELNAYQEGGVLPEGKTKEDMDAIQAELMLALMSMFESAGDSAPEGPGPELALVEDNFYVREGSDAQEAIYLAKVQNTTDTPVFLTGATIVLTDADKNVIGQSDILGYTGSCYLEPGEATFVSIYADLPLGVVVDHYTVNLTTALQGYGTDTILDVAAAELREDNEYGLSYNAAATITNSTEKPMALISVVIAVRDSDGKLIDLSEAGLYQHELGAGSTITLVSMLDSRAVDYCTGRGVKPAQVEALAWIPTF
ncbi:MAG: hypothetical protein J6U01_10695 [Clostridia bacterium]|nr:hypothetical protein [Clostridia bacterium]